MKRMKKILLLMTCTFVLLGTTACGSKDAADNGADQSQTDTTTENQTSTDQEKNQTMNDATGGNGVLDDAVDDVTDGVDRVTDEVTDGVDKAADELTEDNGAEKNTNNSTR